MDEKLWMARDQYGKTLVFKAAHPRKGLLEKLFARSASKMYIDDAQGVSHHIGYVVRGQWWQLFECKGFER